MKDYEMAMLHDNRFGFMRRQSRRRLLIVTLCACLAGYVGRNLWDLPVLTLLCLLVFGGGAVLLRATTRGVADLHDGVLDERQVAVRNSAYLRAYRLLGGAIALLSLGMLVWEIMRWGAVPVRLVQVLTTGCLFLAMIAPSCVVGWYEKA